MAHLPRRRRLRVLPRQIFNISPDGRVATSIDFIRLGRGRPGVLPVYCTDHNGAPEQCTALLHHSRQPDHLLHRMLPLAVANAVADGACPAGMVQVLGTRPAGEQAMPQHGTSVPRRTACGSWTWHQVHIGVLHMCVLQLNGA